MTLNTSQEIEKERKYPTLKRHFCPFNDGTRACECFDKGYKARSREIIKEAKKNL